MYESDGRRVPDYTASWKEHEVEKTAAAGRKAAK